MVKEKVMISQPMAGLREEVIVATRERAIEYLEWLGYEVVNTLFTDEWYSPKAMEARGVVQVPLCFLAKSLENMSKCHAVYFCKGWENARGCKIEHEAAVEYGLDVLYEVPKSCPVDFSKQEEKDEDLHRSEDSGSGAHGEGWAGWLQSRLSRRV